MISSNLILLQTPRIVKYYNKNRCFSYTKKSKERRTENIKQLKVKTIDTLFYDKLGLLIRNARKEQKMSLMELSKITGISRVQLEYYELGYTRIKNDKWKLICKALGLNSKIKVSINGG